MKKNTKKSISKDNFAKMKLPGVIETDISLKPQKQSDLAYELIKEDILFCDLAPGEAVSESQLVERFRLGKASIRSALARLVLEGLVRVVPRTGYIITPLTIRDIKEVFEYRTILELAALERATDNLDINRIRHLDRVCKIGYRPDDRESQKDYLQANQEIHMTIARAAGNERLAAAIQHVLDEMRRMLYLGMCSSDKSDEWQHGHEDFLSALLKENTEEAERITCEQLESGKSLILNAAMTSSDLEEVNIVPKLPTKGPSRDVLNPNYCSTES